MDDAIQNCQDLSLKKLLTDIQSKYGAQNLQTKQGDLTQFLFILTTAVPDAEEITPVSKNEGYERFLKVAMQSAGDEKEQLSPTVTGDSLISTAVEKAISDEFNYLCEQNLEMIRNLKPEVLIQEDVLTESLDIKETQLLFELQKHLLEYQNHLQEKYINSPNYNFIGIEKYKVVSEMLGKINFADPAQSIDDINKLQIKHRELLVNPSTRNPKDNQVEKKHENAIVAALIKIWNYLSNNKGAKLSYKIENVQEQNRMKMTLKNIRGDNETPPISDSNRNAPR
jgi:hypothetical protein